MKIRQAKMDLKLKQEEIRQLQIALSMVSNEHEEGSALDMDTVVGPAPDNAQGQPGLPGQGVGTSGSIKRSSFAVPMVDSAAESNAQPALTAEASAQGVGAPGVTLRRLSTLTGSGDPASPDAKPNPALGLRVIMHLPTKL